MHRRTRRIIIGIGIAVAVAAAIYVISLQRAAGHLREAYAAMARDGRPMDPAKIAPPKLSPAQNAAVLYKEAVSALKDQPSGEQNLLEYLASLSVPFVNGSLASEKLVELERLMGTATVVSALSYIVQGTQRPVCCFDRDYSGRMPTDLPILEDLTRIEFVLAIKVVLEASEPNKAWNAALTQLQFADALRHDPASSSQFTRLGMINCACRTIRRLGETSQPDELTCHRIESLLGDLEDVNSLVRATDMERLLVGERLFCLPEKELYRVLREDALSHGDGTPVLINRIGFRMMMFKPRFIEDHTAYLQVMRMSAQLLGGPYIPREAKMCKEIDDLTRRYSLTSRLAPQAGLLKQLHCRMVAELRVTRAGLALLRYNHTRGSFPRTLDALGSPEPIDPFTQKPLNYRAEDNGFVVYSVGADQQDNGGRPRQSNQNEGYDLVWRFPRPTK